ncbi:MAG: hypothetical protein KatS3mg105_5073 [Gemmatales bacterium]|nr:MAG: hypothetical protein KatS3mg105_5073 [Gemmatales bacterium]
MDKGNWNALLLSWEIRPGVVVVLLAVAITYIRGWWRLNRRGLEHFSARRLASFLAGLTAILIALQSPLDTLSDLSLQVHMVQHLLLMIVAPPLLLIGFPLFPLMAGLPKSFRKEWIVPFAQWRLLRQIGDVILHPVATWTTFVTVLWSWHTPQLYELALRAEGWHRIEHVMFLSASVLFWWPVLRPYPWQARTSRWTLVPYLFAAGVQGTALAGILTFSGRLLYAHYQDAPNIWGLSPLADQALAGAVMWVPMSLVILIALVFVVREAIGGEAKTRRMRSTPHSVVRVPIRKSQAQSVLARLWLERRVRLTLRSAVFILFTLVVIDGFTGPQVSSINLAGVLPWVHWRGILVLTLLLGANFFCGVCPFTSLRSLIRRWWQPTHSWPKRLKTKWLAVLALVVFFWSYEAFSLWDRPFATAAIALGFLIVAASTQATFKDAPFCKYVCPIGQFNFVQSLASPQQVSVVDRDVCSGCRTKDCLAGNANSSGCELSLLLPQKLGNMDCTMCMDCADACPHSNVTLLSLPRTEDISGDSPRSGIGRFQDRPDLTAIFALLLFAALVNAAWMTSPMIALEDHIVRWFGIGRTPITTFGMIFGLVAIPACVLWACGRISQIGSPNDHSAWANVRRFMPAMIPLGFGMWLAHYSFHLATSADSAWIAVRRFIGDWFGTEQSIGTVGCMCGRADSITWLLPLELSFLGFGLFLTVVTSVRIASRDFDSPRPTMVALMPWCGLAVLYYAACVWVLLQPMQMRGAAMAGM